MLGKPIEVGQTYGSSDLIDAVAANFDVARLLDKVSIAVE